MQVSESVSPAATKGDLRSFNRSKSKWLASRKKYRMLLPVPRTTDAEIALNDANKSSSVTNEYKDNGGEASSRDRNEILKQRLESFYKQHCPSKLDNVEKLVKKYKDAESHKIDELFLKLNNKYTTISSKFPMPELRKDTNPKCFFDIQIGGGTSVNVHKIVFQLYDHETPLAVENFRCLCTGEKGIGRSGKPLHFKNSKFHRIIPSFMLQAGDFTKGDGTGGESIYGGTIHGDMWGKFKDEKFLAHSRRGLLSYANNGPNRNSSQFFITLRATPHLDGKHVVFGEIIEGFEALDVIASVDRDKSNKPSVNNEVIIVNCGQIVDKQSHGPMVARTFDFEKNGLCGKNDLPLKQTLSSVIPETALKGNVLPCDFSRKEDEHFSISSSKETSAVPFSEERLVTRRIFGKVGENVFGNASSEKNLDIMETKLSISKTVAPAFPLTSSVAQKPFTTYFDSKSSLSTFSFGTVKASMWPSKPEPDKIKMNNSSDCLINSVKKETCSVLTSESLPLATSSLKLSSVPTLHSQYLGSDVTTVESTTTSSSPKWFAKMNDNTASSCLSQITNSYESIETKNDPNLLSSNGIGRELGRVKTSACPHNNLSHVIECTEKKGSEGSLSTASLTNMACKKAHPAASISLKASSKVNDDALSKELRSDDRKVTNKASNPFSSFTFEKVETPTWPSKTKQDNVEKNEKNDIGSSVESKEKKSDEDSSVKEVSATNASLPSTSNSASVAFLPLPTTSLTNTASTKSHSDKSTSPKATSKVNDIVFPQLKATGCADRKVTKKASNPFSSFTFGKVETPTWPSKSDPDNMEKNGNNDSTKNLESKEKNDGEESFVKQGNDTNASMVPTSSSAVDAIPPLSNVAPKSITESFTNATSTEGHSTASISPKAASKVNDNAFSQVKVPVSDDKEITKKASNPFSSFTFGKVETPTWPSKCDPDNIEKNENNDSGNNLESKEKNDGEDLLVKQGNDTNASISATSNSAGYVIPSLSTRDQKPVTVPLRNTTSTKSHSDESTSPKATSKVNDDVFSQLKATGCADRKVTKTASNPFSSFTFGKVATPTWPSKSDPVSMEKNENNDSAKNLESKGKNNSEHLFVKRDNDTNASMVPTSNSAVDAIPLLSNVAPKSITESFKHAATTKSNSNASISPKAACKVNDNALSQVKVPVSDDKEITKKASNPFSSFTFGKVETSTWPSKCDPDNIEKNENNDSAKNLESKGKNNGEHLFVKRDNDTNASMVPTSNSAVDAIPLLSNVAPKSITESFKHAATTKSNSTASISPKAACKVNDNALSQVKVPVSDDKEITKKASNPFSSFTFGKVKTPTWPSKCDPDNIEKNENNGSGNNLESKEKNDGEDNDTNASISATSNSAGYVIPSLSTRDQKPVTIPLRNTTSTKSHSDESTSPKATSKVNDIVFSQLKATGCADRKVTEKASNPFSSFTFGKVATPTWPSKSDPDNMEKNGNNDSTKNLESNEQNDGEDLLVKQDNDTNASMVPTSNSAVDAMPPLSNVGPKPVTASLKHTVSTKSRPDESTSPKAACKVNDNALSQVKIPVSDYKEITKKASNPFSSFTFGKVETPTWPSKSDPDNMEKNGNNDSTKNLESNEQNDGEESFVKQGNDTNASMVPTSNSAVDAILRLSNVAPKPITASFTNATSTKGHSTASISPKAACKVNDNALSQVKVPVSDDKEITKKASNPFSSFTFGKVETPTWPSKSDPDNIEKNENNGSGNNLESKEKHDDEDLLVKQGNDTNASMSATSNSAGVAIPPLSNVAPKPITASLTNTACTKGHSTASLSSKASNIMWNEGSKNTLDSKFLVSENIIESDVVDIEVDNIMVDSNNASLSSTNAMLIQRTFTGENIFMNSSSSSEDETCKCSFPFLLSPLSKERRSSFEEVSQSSAIDFRSRLKSVIAINNSKSVYEEGCMGIFKFNEESYGTVLRSILHQLIVHSKWTKTLERINAVKGEVTLWVVGPDPSGRVWKCLPIHVACKNNPPIEVIKSLLEAYPESASFEDNLQSLPLHYACAHGATFDVISILTDYCPNAVKSRNRDGLTPLELFSSTCDDTDFSQPGNKEKELIGKHLISKSISSDNA